MYNNTSHKLKQNFNYFTMLKDQMEKHELRAENIHVRRNLLERQKIANRNNELDRVMGGYQKQFQMVKRVWD